jgi:transposase
MVQDHQEDYPSVTAASQVVAKQLGLGRETVRRWVVQADIDAGGRPGLTSVDYAEIKRLKAENRRLREDVEILRSATTFFAGELDFRNR